MAANGVFLATQALDIHIGALCLCAGLNLELAGGQCWGLLGRNGAGKTTLLHTLAGLRPASAGRVLLHGQDLRGLPRRHIAQELGLLLQDQAAQFPITVMERVLAGRYPHLGPWAWSGAQEYQLALHALVRVGLADLAGRNLQTLSGGERQRVAIATLLTQAPRVLLLDEPVNHLDLREQMRVLGLAREFAAAGNSVLMSLHDPNLALRFCDHLLLLDGGQAVCGPTVQMGSAERLSRLYAQPLMALAGPYGPVLVPCRDG